MRKQAGLCVTLLFSVFVCSFLPASRASAQYIGTNLVANRSSAPLATDKTVLDGYWWEKLDASFKIGWVSGYAKAMDLAGTIQMSSCASNMPLYVKEFPNIDPKVTWQKMCLSDNQFDYDGISMGQFVDGMNVFYKDYRNKQLGVGWAIQYARDAVKGKPAQELDAEVTLWRKCSAADKSHPIPRSSEDAAQISKACTPGGDPAAK